MARSKSHASVLNTLYFACLRAAKHANMQCSICALKMVHIFIHIHDEHHKSDKAEVAVLGSAMAAQLNQALMLRVRLF